ncbi:hypothetical protein M427DRAFT_31925 [Gonapodya prolifera JEL478]|uniref:Uncharacterized protein n=1 Tax=Gonapodya prolifera (strain JEL478) TaxID=1344416 RepID=A0A139AHF7_GONPJ|nr:hypothetical protein M427DRAFT_31925 [Gonapodya prolifera JEL478]|eukprot:KXS15994.1 hypothetical protein M427DRAFT_31925 [Gonapodya prolifera JEL478]
MRRPPSIFTPISRINGTTGLPDTYLERAKAEEDRRRKIKDFPQPVKVLAERMVDALRSRNCLEEAWKSYLSLLNDHNSVAHTLSRNDFSQIAHAFASRFPEDSVDDTKRGVEKVQRVLDDMVQMFGQPAEGAKVGLLSQNGSNRPREEKDVKENNVSSTPVLTEAEFMSLALALRHQVLATANTSFVPSIQSFLLKMEELKVPPTLRILNTVIDCLAKSVRIGASTELARETYAFAARIVEKEFPRLRIKPDVITMTALLDLAGRTVPSVTAGAAADTSLDAMVPIEASTNDRESTPMDHTACSMSAPFDAHTLLLFFRTVFRRFGVPPNAYSYTALISHLARAGQIHVASDLLDEAETVPSSRDTLTDGPYSALLTAIARQVEGIIAAECAVGNKFVSTVSVGETEPKRRHGWRLAFDFVP